MASEVQIAKLALQHIGDRFDISDLEEDTPEAEQVNLIFTDTRDALLRQHPWNFAKKYMTPAALSGTVQFDPEFVLHFSYALAAKLAMPLTGERAIANDMEVMVQNMANSAWETDSNEGIEEEPPEATWIQARA